MAFEEIKIDSAKVYTILKIVIMVSIFLVVAFNVLAAASAYEFVYCKNEVTGTIITYPTGTSCDNYEPTTEEGDDDDDEATEQEEEAMEESED